LFQEMTSTWFHCQRWLQHQSPSVAAVEWTLPHPSGISTASLSITINLYPDNSTASQLTALAACGNKIF